MNAGKAVYKGKKLLSCLLSIILILLSCDNIWAAGPVVCVVGDTFTEGDLEYRVIDEVNMYVEVSGLDTQADFSDRLLDIPANVVHNGVTYSVTRIGDSAFSKSVISSVNIPDSVTKIGRNAFSNSEVYTVNIPDSIDEIEDRAFFMCSNLKNVELPQNIEKISADAFRRCGSFTSIVVPEGVKEICDYAFSECWYVQTISLPDSLETIGAGAFARNGEESATGELTVNIPNGVKSIGNSAFYYCKKMKEIVIPSSVETMSKSVFYCCEGLEKVVIEGRISNIPEWTFIECSSLKYIEMPNSVNYIYSGAFIKCSALESITIPESVLQFDDRDVFDDCTSLREMRIAVDVKKDHIIPIEVRNDSKVYFPFQNVPANRELVFLSADGMTELAGTSLVAAQTAYIEANDGDTTDNYWYGWGIGTIADLYTVTIDVKKDGEQWEDHGKKFLLKNEKGYLIDDFQAESGTYTVCVAVGEKVVDTGVTVEVKDSDTSVTIEYFTVTFYDDDTAYENDTIWGQQIVRKDEYAIKPGSDPEKADFKFAGWKTDKEGSKAFDFEAGITDTTDIYASWSEDSEDSTEPTRPSETENPSEPGKPTDTENPTEPSKPSDTENPTEPSKPADTENPAEPTKPSGTENPTEPSKPSETENPTAPSKPAETENPTEPSKPSDTQNPADSNNLADTETTITPNNPTNSEKPSIPSPSPNPNGSSELEEPEASTPIDGAEEGEKPKTGDTSHVEIYATAAMIAGLSYVILMFAKRKEGMTEEEKNNRVSTWLEWARKGSRFRKYVALTAIFFLLLYYHAIGKRLDLEWKEICGS